MCGRRLANPPRHHACMCLQEAQKPTTPGRHPYLRPSSMNDSECTAQLAPAQEGHFVPAADASSVMVLLGPSCLLHPIGELHCH